MVGCIGCIPIKIENEGIYFCTTYGPYQCRDEMIEDLVLFCAERINAGYNFHSEFDILSEMFYANEN